MNPNTRIRSRLDPSLIESELQRLWHQMADQSEDDGKVILKASVTNLVACTDPDAEVEELVSSLSAGDGQQAGRLILLLTHENSRAEGFDFQVTAHCQLQPDGREQLCSEVIRVLVYGDAVPRAGSVVAPILVSDLPVFLWWRRRLDLDSTLLRRLLVFTDHLVVDSGRGNGSEGLKMLAQFLQDEEAQDLIISDLAWSRIQVWRRALAGLYDSLMTRQILSVPTQMRVFFGGPGEPAGEAIYLVAWLASRLGWTFNSPLAPAEQGFEITFDTRESALHVLFLPSPGPGLVGLQMSNPNGLQVELTRRGTEERCQIETLVRFSGAPISRQVLPEGSLEETDLLWDEMGILRRDSVFQRTLLFAGQLVG